MSEAASVPNTRVGRVSQLDKSTLLRLQAACNYINAEIGKVRRRTVIVYVAAAVGLSWIYLAFGVFDGWIFHLVLTAFLGAGYQQWQQRRLAGPFKLIVIRRVVAALGEGLSYFSKAAFTPEQFNAMDCFNTEAEDCTAEDEIRGRKNAVSFSVLEVEASYNDTDSKGSSTKRSIFHGLIARLEFNKNFSSHTIVVPDGTHSSFGVFEADSRGRKDIVRLESVEFEKVFSVYSTDQQEARYLLTPKLMELLLQANATVGGELRACFQDNYLHVLVSQSKDLFGFQIFGRTYTPENIGGELAELVGLTERLIDTLELETRIWSRA